MRRKIGIVLMTIGLTLVFFAAALLFYNNYESKKAEEQANVLVDSLMNAVSENQLDNSEADPFDKEMKIVEINGYGYVGYLSIPKLSIELPVMSECDYDRLKIAPCRYFGSTKTNNLVVAAHNYRSHFGYLGRLKPSDTIMFTDMEGTERTYIVTTVEILKPSDSDKVKDTGDDLILYTCTYRGVSRVVVRCAEVQ